MWRGRAEARLRGHIDHDAGLVAIFGRWSSRNDFHRLNGVERDLVGKHFALLICDRLPVDREGIFGMITQVRERDHSSRPRSPASTV